MERRVSKFSVQQLSKTFFDKDGYHTAVKDVSFDLYDGEFLVLLGPGHCGKTVLLNMLAGLSVPTSGVVYMDGKEHTGINSQIGMVFQKMGLFPFRTVMQNVELGLKFAGVSKKERRETAKKYIDLVGLDGFEHHYPEQLSGGMKQRVGIARAYATNPQVLIMDEPFGQLDAQTRYSMQDEILRIWQQEKLTIIFVTNNIEEACYLGDRIVLLTQCPAEVKNVYDIEMTRPREMTGKEFLRLRERISDDTDLAI